MANLITNITTYGIMNFNRKQSKTKATKLINVTFCFVHTNIPAVKINSWSVSHNFPCLSQTILMMNVVILQVKRKEIYTIDRPNLLKISVVCPGQFSVGPRIKTPIGARSGGDQILENIITFTLCQYINWLMKSKFFQTSLTF